VRSNTSNLVIGNEKWLPERKAIPQGLTKSRETPRATFGRFDASLVRR